MKGLFYLLLAASLLASCAGDGTQQQTDGTQSSFAPDDTLMRQVHFTASDGMEVVADLYPNPKSQAVIILLHQAGASRGEYLPIAPKLVQQGYTCLAVDLRSGAISKEVINKTHEHAVRLGQEPTYAEAEPDIHAAIDFVNKMIGGRIALWGSSYSATLAMMVGRNSKAVDRVIAFSPGLYFGSESSVVSRFQEFGKPLFVTCAKTEVERVRSFVMPAGEQFVTFREPEFAGAHGSQMLWVTNSSTEEIFNDILRFLK